MDTSDESMLTSVLGSARNVVGKKAFDLGDPIGRKVLKKSDKKLEDEEELRRQEAARLDEEKRTVTAGALPQLTELERRNRRRRASVLTRGFEQPTLGRTGLLG